MRKSERERERERGKGREIYRFSSAVVGDEELRVFGMIVIVDIWNLGNGWNEKDETKKGAKFVSVKSIK